MSNFWGAVQKVLLFCIQAILRPDIRFSRIRGRARRVSCQPAFRTVRTRRIPRPGQCGGAADGSGWRGGTE